MAKEKPYLDSTLNIKSLANVLNTNTSYLSKVINQTEADNFNDYINKFRVSEIEQKLANNEQENLTFLSLAYECGFNSKATFNRSFKKHTGFSPRVYASTLKKKG